MAIQRERAAPSSSANPRKAPNRLASRIQPPRRYLTDDCRTRYPRERRHLTPGNSTSAVYGWLRVASGAA